MTNANSNKWTKRAAETGERILGFFFPTFSNSDLFIYQIFINIIIEMLNSCQVDLLTCWPLCYDSE